MPEAAADKHSFCDRLRGAGVDQQAADSMQTLGAAVVSAATKLQQELGSAAAAGNRRFLQDQINTINFSPAPAPQYNVTVPVVSAHGNPELTRKQISC